MIEIECSAGRVLVKLKRLVAKENDHLQGMSIPFPIPRKNSEEAARRRGEGESKLTSQTDQNKN